MTTVEFLGKLEAIIFPPLAKVWPGVYGHITEVNESWVAVYVYWPADKAKDATSYLEFSSVVMKLKRNMEEEGLAPGMVHEQKGKIVSEELYYFIFWLPLSLRNEVPPYCI